MLFFEYDISSKYACLMYKQAIIAFLHYNIDMLPHELFIYSCLSGRILISTTYTVQFRSAQVNIVN